MTAWMARGAGRSSSSGRSRYTPRPPVPYKLAPYTRITAARLEEFPELSAKRLFDEVWASGYSGGYSRLRDYFRAVRPRRRGRSATGHEAISCDLDTELYK